MEIFANQKIQWKENKFVRRTVVVRATLAQMTCANGIVANIPSQGSFLVLRWGECKRHKKNCTTRRVNVFQVLAFGQPQWVCQSLIENSQRLDRVIYASATIGLYNIRYSLDFIPPTRKVNLQCIVPVKSTPEVSKVCNSPSLPSLTTLTNVIPQLSCYVLPPVKKDKEEIERRVVLPRIDDLDM
ncbi:hypothetical protein ENUP19_0040G0007 [Entamoeba nuttalli]|uniref:Uncharacterized protein n=2 Tax=Entamoeba nuttalli TaxID=412467 RepID=A0ABQ0D9T4_9EUKA